MMQIDWRELEKKLKKEQKGLRFQHTLGVAYTAAALALRWDVDMDRARLAGLLHDCAKCLSDKKKLEICEEQQLEVSDFEKEHPVLLHAKVGTYLAEADYGITDAEILSAINWHTTGRPGMTRLEQIIFVADYIEPNRNKAPNLQEVRGLAFQDLDRCTYRILQDTVDYLKKNPKSMDRMTMRAFTYYYNLLYPGTPGY